MTLGNLNKTEETHSVKWTGAVDGRNYELPLSVAARARVCAVFCRSTQIQWVNTLLVASEYVWTFRLLRRALQLQAFGQRDSPSQVSQHVHDSQTWKTLASCTATDCSATQTACMLTPTLFTTNSPYLLLSPEDRAPALFLGTQSENLFQDFTVSKTKFFIIVVSRNFYVEKAIEIPAPCSVRFYRFGNLISMNQAIKECSRAMSFLNAQVRKNEKASRLMRSGSRLRGRVVHLDPGGFV